MSDIINKKGIISGILANGEKFQFEKFVAEIQGFLVGLKLTHWETTSYELHKAVECTENSFSALIDDFVEAYIGSTGGIRPDFNTSIEAIKDPARIIACLKSLNIRDTSLLNIRDEMLQVLYKHKYLVTLK